MTESYDMIVVGAGIVGTSTALQLQRRGRKVTLVDRGEPGKETSFGNAGVIEGGVYVPLGFPRDPLALLRYAMNRQSALHFHWRFLPRIAPWIFALFRNSSQERLRHNGEAIMTLTAHAVEEHRSLLREAGAEALMRDTGWLRLYRSETELRADNLEMRMAEERGLTYSVLDAEEARELEPHLAPQFEKAVYWPLVSSVSNPGAVTGAAAGLFAAAGGRFERRVVRKIAPHESGWRVATEQGTMIAGELVVALGPWSMDLLRPLAYRFPFAMKRGYHVHYRPQGDAALSRPIVDGTYGYVLAPTSSGIRLTTGIEFAAGDAPMTPVQIDRAERHARVLFPLAQRIDEKPWMGRRPCFPDSRPIIGPAPDHRGLWLNFGHAHLGFTLGPVSGKLLAQMVIDEQPLVDPVPFAATRFS